jgi:hypothetical protein
VGAGEELEAQPEDLGAASPTWLRLEDQIEWYDRVAASNQRWFKWLKVVQIVAAAAVPVVAALAAPGWVAGALGSLVVVLEGVQQLFQFQQNWVSYRSTCEALKHEKFLYLATAGPYAPADRPQALLAERVEGLVSQETAKWASQQEEAVRGEQENQGAG